MTIVLNSKLQVMKVLSNWVLNKNGNYKVQITKEKYASVCLMLSKTFPTLFLSSLDLFIGQECSSTCSDRALQMERVGGKLGQNCFRSWGRLILPNP